MEQIKLSAFTVFLFAILSLVPCLHINLALALWGDANSALLFVRGAVSVFFSLKVCVCKRAVGSHSNLYKLYTTQKYYAVIWTGYTSCRYRCGGFVFCECVRRGETRRGTCCAQIDSNEPHLHPSCGSQHSEKRRRRAQGINRLSYIISLVISKINESIKSHQLRSEWAAPAPHSNLWAINCAINAWGRPRKGRKYRVHRQRFQSLLQNS
jgi:hypothetical protein